MRHLLALALVAAVLGGCPLGPAPPPPTPSPDYPPYPDDAASPATCAGWCKHAAALKCPSAQTTPGGATCAAVCSNVQASGGEVKWDLKCRTNAKTCAAADECENK